MMGEVPTVAAQQSVLDTAQMVAARAPGPERNIVMPLFANFRMMAMLKNLLCSIDRVGVYHWFVLSFDDKLCPALDGDFWRSGMRPAGCTHPYTRFEAAAHGVNATSDIPRAHSTYNALVQAGGDAVRRSAVYRSRLFNAVVFHRVAWLRLLLQANYSILHCDADVVWLRNPLPLFEQDVLVRPSGHTATYRASDLLVQSEGVYGNNGGFYFARANSRTVAFFDALLRKFHERSRVKNSNFEDQHCLNDVLRDARKHRKGLSLKAPKLNQTLFPNGAMWQSGLATKALAYVVHMNWAKQSKKSRLVEDGLWFLTPEDARCATRFDPQEGSCERRCVALKKGTLCELGRPCAMAECTTLLRSVNGSHGWHPVALQRAGCS